MNRRKRKERIENLVRLRKYEEKQAALDASGLFAVVKEREEKLKEAKGRLENIVRVMDEEADSLRNKLGEGMKAGEIAMAADNLALIRRRLEQNRKEVATCQQEVKKFADKMARAQSRLAEKSSQRKAAEKFLASCQEEELREEEKKREE